MKPVADARNDYGSNSRLVVKAVPAAGTLPCVPPGVIAAMSIVGADTAFPVTPALIKSATDTMGQAPLFWGRYFTSPQTTGSVEYRHALEDAVLAAAGIRVLPIARQTNDVGGTEASGQADGAANALDLIKTFREQYLADQCGAVMVFLDVEGSGRSRMSADYYTGWAAGLGAASAYTHVRTLRLRPPGRCRDVDRARPRHCERRPVRRPLAEPPPPPSDGAAGVAADAGADRRPWRPRPPLAVRLRPQGRPARYGPRPRESRD